MHSPIQRAIIAFCLFLGTTACFPTFQTARVEPGFRLEASAVVLADQPRNSFNEGPDIIAALNPAYGFGKRVEIGFPFELYAENGLFNSSGRDKNSGILMPYVKVALLDTDSPNHAAVVVQTAWILPANIGLHYGHDFGSWEPHVGLTYIFSGGNAGDDPFITRYQEPDQTLFALSAGATFNRWRNTSFEVGVLRNSYGQSVGPSPGGDTFQKTTLYDAYAGIRLRLFGGPRRSRP